MMMVERVRLFNQSILITILKIHGYSRPSGTNKEENKKNASDDKVGPIYVLFLEEYCSGILRAWKKGSYSRFIMVCVTRTTVSESPSVFQVLSRPCTNLV